MEGSRNASKAASEVSALICLQPSWYSGTQQALGCCSSSLNQMILVNIMVTEGRWEDSHQECSVYIHFLLHQAQFNELSVTFNHSTLRHSGNQRWWNPKGAITQGCK